MGYSHAMIIHDTGALAPLHIAWIARSGAIGALRAAGIRLPGRATAVLALTPVIAELLAGLDLTQGERFGAAGDPLRLAATLLADAGLIQPEG